ncbi:MAG TPA: phosphoribulokinase [Solirubrobacterales bacterium]|nr:phosphoribulokinase [Solirubrobacterales bacterium]
MPRPLLLGIVGDSGTGKTTLTRGLVRILGERRATHISGDHYQRLDREQRAEHGITPLHPDGNHLDVLAQHLVHLRAGEPILKPVYRHRDGTFGAAEYVRPADFTIVEGILAFHTEAMCDAFDVRVFLDPPEDLRRRWKVQRDCSRRGYTTDEVLEELDRREADAERFVRPQRRHADIVVAFMPGDRGDDEHLDAKVTLRPGLVHPDLSTVLAEGADGGMSPARRGEEVVLWIPGTIEPERSAAIQEAIWDRMQFASHLRNERLGEFTTGTELRRSESLAIVQLLVLYQAVTGRAAIAVGALAAGR